MKLCSLKAKFFHAILSKISDKDKEEFHASTWRWFDTFFSGPYLAFSMGVLSTVPWSDRNENNTSFCKKIEVWLNVFIKVIDIYMETINQKKKKKIGKAWILYKPDLL